MEVALTWDLVVMLFFVIIMAYSYIVGQNGTIKIILSSYIAMLAANGIGNLVAKYILVSQPLIKIMATTPQENVVIFKMLIFVTITLLLVLKGSFEVDVNRHQSSSARFIGTSIFGFLSAGLLISTILVFIAGSSIDGVFMKDIQEAINLPYRTLFVGYLVNYYNFWFAAPAIAFVALSALGPTVSPITMIEDDE
jgi:hypothetical protein